MRYNNGVNQYTEREMTWRVWRLLPRIMRKRGFDILLTHAPGKGMVDCHDLCHTGFETFNRLLDKYQPPCFFTDTPISIMDEISPGRAATGRPGW